MNPLTRGPFARSRDLPCWPWRKGTYRSPEGNGCRLCAYNHEIGGFKASNGKIDECFQAAKTSDSLVDEWRACLNRLNELTNSGKIRFRLKGHKRARLSEQLAELRQKTVEIVKSSGINVKEKFKAIVLTRWLDKHVGQDPRAQGHVSNAPNHP